MVTDEPVPLAVPVPHAPVPSYQYQSAPSPKLPPFTLNVTLLPRQMLFTLFVVILDVALVGSVDASNAFVTTALLTE
jgi:hypothetical protein